MNISKLALTAIAMGSPLIASANLVVDGNFAPPPSGGVYNTIYSPGATIGGTSGWTVTAGSVDVIGSYWVPPAGSGPTGQSVDMSGNQNGTIQQAITLDPGTYLLSFYLSGNPDGPPQIKELEASLGGTTEDFFYTIGANTRANMMYQQEFMDVTVTGGSPLSTSLTFSDLSAAPSTTPWGAVLGNVQLTAVPEPGTLISGALLLLPFGASTFRIMRKSRQV